MYLTDLAPDVLGERSAGATSYPVGFLQSAAFVNDDFRIMPNLTLNLGLRYEYVTVPVASRYQEFSSPASVYGGTHLRKTRTIARPISCRESGLLIRRARKATGPFAVASAKAYDLTYSNLTANAAPPYFQQTNDCPGVNCAHDRFPRQRRFAGNRAVPLPTDQAGALGVLSSYTYGGKRPYGLDLDPGRSARLQEKLHV